MEILRDNLSYSYYMRGEFIMKQDKDKDTDKDKIVEVEEYVSDDEVMSISRRLMAKHKKAFEVLAE